jgi:cyclic pyranopterin phosphate synthase
MNHDPRHLDSFRIFNEAGGKFRLAIINLCNLDCFFCHNEGMPNPRRGEAAGDLLDVDRVVAIADAYARLGGRQINLTGGEPLAHPRLFEILERIDRRDTRLAINTNALLANRLLARPPSPAVDHVLASLHTTSDRVFRDQLGGRDGSAARVMGNIAALALHGYRVCINFSLGQHNLDGFEPVLDFAVEHGIDLKAIALVRSSTDPDFYGGDWIEPSWLAEKLAARGAEILGTRDAFGGRKSAYRIGASRIEVKNIADGRLRTDFCRGCLHQDQCGEGIYGVRVGMDGVIKPCLLRRERFRSVDSETSYEAQILATIHAMVGNWDNARFVKGAPA